MPPSCTAQVGPTLRTGRDGRRKRQRKGRNQSGKTRNKRERLATSARRDDVRSRYERNPQARAKNIRHSLGVYCTMHTKVFTVYENSTREFARLTVHRPYPGPFLQLVASLLHHASGPRRRYPLAACSLSPKQSFWLVPLSA